MAPWTRARKRRAENLLTLLDYDLLTHVACFMSAKTLGQLACVCRRFSFYPANDDDLSAVEQAAKSLVARYSPAELARVCIARDGRCWLLALAELEMLAEPPRFSHFDTRCYEVGTLAHDSAIAIPGWDGCSILTALDRIGCSAALCHRHVMRAGCHYAEVAILRTDQGRINLGVSRLGLPLQPPHRPCWQYDGFWGVFAQTGHLFYAFAPHNGEEWPGQESLEEGDRIGLLLNSDRGILTLYKNGQRLGVAAQGLKGEELVFAFGLWDGGDVIAIRDQMLPPVSADELRVEATDLLSAPMVDKFQHMLVVDMHAVAAAAAAAGAACCVM
jgi:hypothetical protein